EDLDEDERERLAEAISATLGGALAHYEEVLQVPITDKLPMPLRVHRHEGQQCPRCGATLKSVHFEDYVIAYCPACQTDGRTLKDRRLSRLLRGAAAASGTPGASASPEVGCRHVAWSSSKGVARHEQVQGWHPRG